MNLRSRYGYLILALKQYPFDKEIKDRIEEIEVPWKTSDPNAGIKSNKTVTPKALSDIIKKESDPELHRLELMKEAISSVKVLTPENEWTAIKAIYIEGTLTVEGASIKYLHCSKSLTYKEVIEPFFNKLEKKIFELSANSKFKINLEKS
ncbi:hypothetical protein [Streptococcus rubneri]|uniref:hypothetical protein n=1 Tax=Streptococcus rubneri TaxID=1234680 RepID=UPI00189D2EA6|nr:hypothetical protein [Streptococcus rubneri]